MLKRNFDAQRPHRYVRYGRMSTEMQNPRSPEQQFASIELTLRRLGRPWVGVRDYRDDAISGRYVAKRPQLQQMLRDLRSGAVDATLILVDTFERFGRAEEIAALRQDLQARHGILVLTADSQFADPTTAGGRALAMVESIRSTEDGRIKAHNVLRGKRDLAARGRWPGGPIPLGYRLESVMVEVRGRRETEGHVLVPDPASASVPATLYALARETGWGTRRLARALNADPTVPSALKPMSAERVRHVLESTLYVGVLTYGRHCTGIVNDRLIRERTEPGEALVVPDFCPPLVDRPLAEAVWAIRRAAAEGRPRARPRRRVELEGDDGRPGPIVPRNHLLTGLARCGECGGSMKISSTTTRKDGRPTNYAYYGCWRHPSRQCENGRHFREDVLREAVVAKLRWRLFPPPGDPGAVPDWLPGLVEEVRRQLDELSKGEEDPRPRLRREQGELTRQLSGWAQSLANPGLAASLRLELEGRWSEAKADCAALEARLAELEATPARLEAALDPSAVLGRLRRLSAVLEGGNVVEGNRELARHIERIACHGDGRVELRTHRLGVFEGLSEWLSPGGPGEGGGGAAPPGGLYWSDALELRRPRRRPRACWSRDHAEEVLAKREETGWPIARLARHFGRCRETIEVALRVARGRGPAASPGPGPGPG